MAEQAGREKSEGLVKEKSKGLVREKSKGLVREKNAGNEIPYKTTVQKVAKPKVTERKITVQKIALRQPNEANAAIGSANSSYSAAIQRQWDYINSRLIPGKDLYNMSNQEIFDTASRRLDTLRARQLYIAQNDTTDPDEVARLSEQAELVDQQIKEMDALKVLAAPGAYLERETAYMQQLMDSDAGAAYKAGSEAYADQQIIMRLVAPNASNQPTYKADALEIAAKYGVTPDSQTYQQDLTDLYSRLDGEIAVSDQTVADAGFDADRVRAYEQRLVKEAESYEARANTMEFAREHPVLSSAIALGFSTGSDMEFIYQLLKSIGHSDIDDLDTYVPLTTADMGVANLFTDVTSSVADLINENTSIMLGDRKLGEVLYSSGMLLASSLLNMGLAGKGAKVLMALSSASYAMRDAIEMGASNHQAIVLGTLAGAAEYAAEKYGIESFLDMVKGKQSVNTTGGLVKFALKQMGFEASEEAITSTANILSEALVLGKLSSTSRAVQNYMTSGMTESEAKMQALRDNIRQVMWSTAEGAIAGGGMSAIGGALRAPDVYRYSRDIKTQTDALNQQAMRVDEEIRPAQRVAKNETIESLQQYANEIASAMQKQKQRNAADQTVEAAAPADYDAYRRQISEDQPGLVLGGRESRIADTLPADQAAEFMQSLRKGRSEEEAYRDAVRNIPQQSAAVSQTPGLVRDQAYRRNRYDARTERELDTIARTAGVAVTVADRVDVLDDTGAVVGEANAKYDPDTGTITISRQTEDPVRAVFLHEMVHRIRSAAPEAYAQMAKFVVDNMSGANYEKAMAGRATQYGTTESAYLQEELVADAFGRILYDTDAVASFVRQHRNAAQRLLDAIRDFLDRLRGRSGDGSLTLPKVEELSDFTGKAEQMARLLEAALNDTMQRTQQAGKGDLAGRSARFSIRKVNGEDVVWIENSSLTNRELNSHKAVADFIEQYIGEVYTIIESGQKVYIGHDLPGEYTQSRYTAYLRNTDRAGFRAKRKAIDGLGELIETATNRRWERTRHTQSKDAKYGMYRYDSTFAFPVRRSDGTVQNVRAYDVELLIRNASDGNKYLYDIVNIKENISAQSDLNEREARSAASQTATGGDVSNTSISKAGRNVKESLSLPSPVEETRTLPDGQKNIAQAGGKTRYLINRMFPAEIRTWDQEGRADGKRFTLGSTGPVLQGLGAIESDIYMNSDKINTILKVHPEMTIREIQKIPEILEDPVLVLKSKGSGRRGNNSRLVLFGTIKAQNGQPIMSVLDLRPTENGFLLDDMQKVNSSYTKKNPAYFVSDSEVLYADKNRTIPLLRRFGLTIASRELLQSGSIGSISYSGTNVNLSGVPFSSVVEIGERSSNGMGEGADQRNRADRYSVKTPLADPAQEESGTGTPEPTGLSLPAPPKAQTDDRHWMDKDERAVYHETEETPLLPLRWNGETPVEENGADGADSSIEKVGAERGQGEGNFEKNGNYYQIPRGGGGVTFKMKVGNIEVSFGHGGRHLEGTSLSFIEVNQAIANDVAIKNVGPGQFYKGRINMNGTEIEYTSFGVKEGSINIGTYYPV